MYELTALYRCSLVSLFLWENWFFCLLFSMFFSHHLHVCKIRSFHVLSTCLPCNCICIMENAFSNAWIQCLSYKHFHLYIGLFKNEPNLINLYFTKDKLDMNSLHTEEKREFLWNFLFSIVCRLFMSNLYFIKYKFIKLGPSFWITLYYSMEWFYCFVCVSILVNVFLLYHFRCCRLKMAESISRNMFCWFWLSKW